MTARRPTLVPRADADKLRTVALAYRHNDRMPPAPSAASLMSAEPPTGQRHQVGRSWFPIALLALVAITVLLRLPFVSSPASADESGFLIVGGQWHSGSSLYGSYWVDRPPLLIALFGLADLIGGLPGLRLLGCLAAATTVLGVGLAVRRVAGPAAGIGSAAVACGLLVSPPAGGLLVSGELLAAPFVAVGCWLAVCSVTDEVGSRSCWQALGAGACAAAAVLVKQNMIDVIVFSVALGVLCWAFQLLPFKRLCRIALCFVAGGVLTAAVVFAAALSRRTDPGAVLYAMYAFRLRATDVLAHVSTAQRVARLSHLGHAALLSGGPLLLVALASLLVRRATRGDGPRLAVALAALTLAFYAVISVAAGGGYFLPYLVQLVVPTALAGGLMVAMAPRLGGAAVAVVLGTSLVMLVTGLSQPVESKGELAGEAVRAVSEPGDTMVIAFGESDMLYAARAASPYPYLWALPARTLDRHFRRLAHVLAGEHAPTWFVVRAAPTTRVLDRNPPGKVLAGRYHYVGSICERLIYLLNGVQRATPTHSGGCTRPRSPWFDSAQPLGGS